MNTKPRILFYVQYLLGIGHIRRSSLVIQALCKQGVIVDVIFGGVKIQNISFGTATVHQLPAVKAADANFSGLVKEDNSPFTEADKLLRAKQLLDICELIKPNLIVTETYPFGRRQMRFELLPLIQWVNQQKTPPTLVASIRDILQKRSTVREQECVELINQHYDHVLVHGDPDFLPLENSFDLTDMISKKLTYSGYVCPTLDEHTSIDGHDASTKPEVVVSIGGGSVGKEILKCALELQQTGYLADHNWLLITGPNMPAADKRYFKEQQNDHIKVVDLADNFLWRLKNAYVSISMAGYNTVMDLLLTKVPAVVIPFEGSGETEQITRSEILAGQRVLESLKQSEMNPVSLKHSIEKTISNKQQAITIDSDGAYKSASSLTQWAQKHQDTISNE